LNEGWDYPLFGRFETPVTVQIPGYPFDHQLRVWLPPSYAHTTDRLYPVLWVTDNTLEIASGAMVGGLLGYAPELILVGFGGAGDTLSAREFQRRRTYDYYPGYDEVVPAVREALADREAVGGAPRFRDFLIDELRPRLAGRYRMSPDDHGLAGHSGGADFTLYSLLTRPDGFAKYLISSPGNNYDLQGMEAACAARSPDIQARVFVSVGGAELTDAAYTADGKITGWTSAVSFIGALLTRGYPSLELEVSIFPDQDHFSVWPMTYAAGIRALWREDVPGLTIAERRGLVTTQPWLEQPR
jgi:predicted alpha/beta superfamily hydrolase